MMSSTKNYSFDEKLGAEDIKYIDREIINMIYQEIRCDRCNAQLRYVNLLRIEESYYNIGDDCYQSIKVKLSEIRNLSLYHVRIILEEPYDRYLDNKWTSKKEYIFNKSESPKSHPDYSKYLTLKWDSEHGGLPNFRKEEYERLKKQFKKE